MTPRDPEQALICDELGVRTCCNKVLHWKRLHLCTCCNIVKSKSHVSDRVKDESFLSDTVGYSCFKNSKGFGRFYVSNVLHWKRLHLCTRYIVKSKNEVPAALNLS